MENITTRNNILKCALQLFGDRGYENVSVQEIVDVSGITKPTLYYYFGNKEGVLASILDEGFARLDSVLSEAAVYVPKPELYEEDVYPLLSRVIMSYFDHARCNQYFYRLFLTLQYLPDTHGLFQIIQERSCKQYETIQQMFADIAKTHGNMKGREERYAWSFLGLVNAYIGLSFKNKVQLSQQTAQEVARQFMHGIFS